MLLVKDIIRNRSIFFKMILVFSIILIFIFTYYYVVDGRLIYRDNLMSESYDDNYLTITPYDIGDSNINLIEYNPNLENLESIEEVYYSRTNRVIYSFDEFQYFLYIGGSTVNFKEIYLQYGYHYGTVNILEIKNKNLFFDQIYNEMIVENNDPYLIYGRNILNENEIILSNQYALSIANYLGCSLESLINQDVSFSSIIEGNKKIVGIFDYNFRKLFGYCDIILNVEENSVLSEESEYKCIINDEINIKFNTFDVQEDLLEIKEMYVNHDIYYQIEGDVNYILRIEKEDFFIRQIVSTLLVCVIITLLLSLAIFLYKNMQEKIACYALMNALGYTKRRIIILIIFKQLIAFLLSLIIAWGLSLLYANIILKYILEIEVEFSLAYHFGLISIVSSAFILLIILFNIILIKFKINWNILTYLK